MIRCPVTNQLLLESQTASAPLIVNEAFYRFEALVRVEDSTLTSPPAGPHALGRCFLLTSVPSGVWTGMVNHIVVWTGAHWQAMPPIAGMQTYCATTHRKFQYNPTAGYWLVLYGAYNMGSFSSGTASLDGSQGSQFEIAATGSFSLSTVVGTIRPGQTYFAIIKNTSGSSRTVTFTSGRWIGGGSSAVIANNQIYSRKFTRAYTGNASVVLTASLKSI